MIKFFVMVTRYVLPELVVTLEIPAYIMPHATIYAMKMQDTVLILKEFLVMMEYIAMVLTCDGLLTREIHAVQKIKQSIW